MTVRRIDVAKAAGTSPAVVSYVLNGGPRGVAPPTRARVLAAVEQLGYRPNGVARSLRMNRTMSLGLVLPDSSNPFFAELGRAIEDAAYARGYTLLIGNASERDERQTAYVRTFLQRQVDGLILAPAHGPIGCRDELASTRTPWVAVDRRPAVNSSFPCVLVDNRGGARTATEHLLEHGRTRIGCIGGPEDVMPAADRVAGWRDAMTAAGRRPGTTVWHVPFGRRSGYLAARDILTTTDVDSLFVASDEQALGVLRAAAELGLSCPDDVAIASFDGVPAAAYATPALTTMTQPFARLGQAAVEALLARIGGDRSGGDSTVLPVTLTRRGSCGCIDPPGGDHGQTDHADGDEELGGPRDEEAST